KFAAGAALMEHDEGPDWIRARDEYFGPLLDDDPRRWESQIQPYLDRIEIYELKRGSRPTVLRRQASPRNEPERLLRLAASYRDSGDVARAEHTLAALLTLLGDDEKHATVAHAAGEMLTELRAQRSEHAAHDEFLRDS